MQPKHEYQRRKAEQESAAKKAKALKGFGKSTFRHTDSVARFTFWVAAFTLVIACVGVLQAWAFVQSERAFISVAVTGIDGGKLVIGKPIMILSAIMNSGKSMAFVKEATFDTRLDKDIPDVPVYIKGSFNIQGPLTPNSGTTGSAPITNHLGNVPLVRDEDIAKINGGDATIFGFGYVTYSDDFSFLFGRRTIGFCARFNAHGGDAAGTFEGCGKPAYVYLR